ncbi:hypothetical protein NQ176_g1224 [Zarea fungicola]|uniref:Uncharacterized protein n=1 Tax=Zarea fungicola TaxID=93591 RepID=A0ACC1NTQ0_9HYPO|nr:hypothetical protein NQ176_g1224 [Lecanicillium fungicola]
MQTEELRQRFLSYLAVSNQHDVEAMRKFYSPTIRINDNPRTPMEVTNSFTGLWQAFPDWTWQARHITIEGDYIAVQFSQSGTHTGIFKGIEPTGRRVVAAEFSLYLFDTQNGVFTDIWDLNDSAAILAQINA